MACYHFIEAPSMLFGHRLTKKKKSGVAAAELIRA